MFLFVGFHDMDEVSSPSLRRSHLYRHEEHLILTFTFIVWLFFFLLFDTDEVSCPRSEEISALHLCNGMQFPQVSGISLKRSPLPFAERDTIVFLIVCYSIHIVFLVVIKYKYIVWVSSNLYNQCNVLTLCLPVNVYIYEIDEVEILPLSITISQLPPTIDGMQFPKCQAPL